MIIELIANIVSPDERRRKYSDKQVLKMLVMLQIFSISYRSFRTFLTNHEEYLRMTGVNEIPSFQTLSGRASLFDLHAINREITFIYAMESIPSIDFFMIYTCKYSTAVTRKCWGNYRDPESGWSKTTKGWAYGRKCHMSLDIDSLLIKEWLVTNKNIHDARESHEMVDSVRDFAHILADSAYETSNIYDYVF